MRRRPKFPERIGSTDDMDQLKRQAAARALEYVRDGMKLGLGTGSTRQTFRRSTRRQSRRGLRVIGVPTSEATRADAEAGGSR